jgi:hypothetical protein
VERRPELEWQGSARPARLLRRGSHCGKSARRWRRGHVEAQLQIEAAAAWRGAKSLATASRQWRRYGSGLAIVVGRRRRLGLPTVGGASKQVCSALAPATGVPRPAGTCLERRMGVSCGHGEGKRRQRAHRQGRGRGQRRRWRRTVLRDAGKSGWRGLGPLAAWARLQGGWHAWSTARCCGASGMRKPVQSSSKAFMVARHSDRESPSRSANRRKEKGLYH